SSPLIVSFPSLPPPSSTLFPYTTLFRSRRIRDAMDRLIPDVAGAGAAKADVIIEAIFEDLKAKRELFAKLEAAAKPGAVLASNRSEEHTSELQSPDHLVCRLLLEKKKSN